LSLLGVFFGIGALAMPSALAALSHRYPLDRIVAGIGVLSLLPAIYCLMIAFPQPKLRSEQLSLRKTLGLFRDPLLFFACMALAVQSGMEGLSNDWMTRFFKRVVLAGAGERSAQLSLIALTGAMVATRFMLAGVLTGTGSRLVLLASLVTTLAGALVLLAAPGMSVTVALIGPLLIGAGLAAVFPIVLGYVGDRYPQQSGTAFSTIFVVALSGNMAINKAFGYLAQEYGIKKLPLVLIVLLILSAAFLHLVNQYRTSTSSDNL
jgi:FHS family glucose/mannose:H+ symporter-like MFS transporter